MAPDQSTPILAEQADRIRVTDLSFTYPDGRVGLSDLSFCIPSGETVGLVGPNGAGKTTLLHCLAGVLKFSQGSIFLSGLTLPSPNATKELPRRVGMVFQNSDDQLFCSTLLDDVAFGPLNLGLSKTEVKIRVTEALAAVGLSGQEQRVPYHLSGGEKRRAAIATVLSMRPEILLLDEPTIFLDPRGRQGLLMLIKSLPGTKLIATHDLGLVRECCTRVLLLDGGKLCYDGAVAELLEDQEKMIAHGLGW